MIGMLNLGEQLKDLRRIFLDKREDLAIDSIC